jgi:hypothetical protein
MGSAIVAVLALLVPTTAQAAPSGGVDTSHSRAVKTPSASATSAVAAAACAITRYGYTGYEVCGYGHSALDWGGGNVETFVVGTNYEIYHIWKGSGGWKSLGGQSSRSNSYGAQVYNYPVNGVATVGTNNLLYCRDWPWSSGWFRCS